MAEASEQAYREEKLRRKIKAGNAKTEVHIDARRAYKRSQAEKLGQIDDPKLRYQASAQAFLDAKEAEYASHPTEKYCPRCWSVLRGCICTLLRPIQTRHHYINWLHYKETWRTTNTGTLLPHSCDNARTLIFGRSGDDAELDRILKDEAAHTVFLYPSPGSITVRHSSNVLKVDNSTKPFTSIKRKLTIPFLFAIPKIREFYEKQRSPEEGPIADWDEFIKTAPVLNVIGIDATWSLSRSMSSAVPSSIVRVHLADPPKFSVSNMRNQSSQGRITTAEGTPAKRFFPLESIHRLLQ